MSMKISITRKEALRCWRDRRKGDDVCGYDFTDHDKLISIKGPEDVEVYLSPEGKVIATKGGWAHDITDML